MNLTWKEWLFFAFIIVSCMAIGVPIGAKLQRMKDEKAKAAAIEKAKKEAEEAAKKLAAGTTPATTTPATTVAVTPGVVASTPTTMVVAK